MKEPEIQVIPPSQRIDELEEELRQYRGGGSGLMEYALNPQKLGGLLQLQPEQAQNVKALITGAGTAASVKYLGKQIGDVPAALLGAAATAYVVKKVFGR